MDEAYIHIPHTYVRVGGGRCVCACICVIMCVLFAPSRTARASNLGINQVWADCFSQVRLTESKAQVEALHGVLSHEAAVVPRHPTFHFIHV